MADLTQVQLPNGVTYDIKDANANIVKTASGNPCSFSTSFAGELQSLKCDITAKQDLHGYDHPWAGGAGKNKLPNTFEQGDVSASVGNAYENCKVASAVTIRTINLVSINNATMTVSIKNGFSFALQFFDNDQKLYIDTGSNQWLTSPTTISNVPFVAVIIKKNDGTTITPSQLSNAECQLEFGSTATAYEPYSNICPIVGHSELNLIRCGINLWDGVAESGYIYNGNEYPSASYWRTKNYIPIVPNTEYYFRASANDGQINWYDINKTFISAEGSMGGADRVATSPANAYFVRFYQPNSSDVSDTGVNYPATDTDYHAYNGQTFTVAFGQTVYGGVYDKSGRLTITHKVIALDQISWDYSAGSLFMASIADCALVLNQESVANWKCSCFPIIAQSGHQAGISGISGSNWFNGLTFWNEEGYTQATFETAISGQYIAYELATPIVIGVPSISVFAENGVNNIVSDCGGDVDVEYYTDLAEDIKDFIGDGVEVGDLANVEITTPTNDQILTYEEGKWVNANATDTKVTQTPTTDNHSYEVLLSGSTASWDADTTKTEGVYKNSALIYNPQTNALVVRTNSNLVSTDYSQVQIRPVEISFRTPNAKTRVILESSGLSMGNNDGTKTIGITSSSGDIETTGNIEASAISATSLNGVTIGSSPKFTDTHRTVEIDSSEVLGDNTTPLNLVSGTGIRLGQWAGSGGSGIVIDATGPSVTDISSQYTITKSSGNANLAEVKAHRSGNVICMQIMLRGAGSNWTAGSNIFVGTVTGPLPTVAVNGCGYYDNACFIARLNNTGGITFRWLVATKNNVATSQTIVATLTFITND